MNRVLQRPMFRIGGSAGTGITSGLDQPRKQYANGTKKPSFEDYLKERGMIEKRENLERLMREYEEDMRRKNVREQKTMAADGGRIGYQQGSMPNFQMGGVPGFLTGFGLNLLATPPQGNIFQTAATAAKDPFNRLQASQAAAMKTASDRAFAKELAEEERDFLRGETTRKLESAERIAGMKTTDTTERVRAIADTRYEGDEIKAAREVNFPSEVYPTLVAEYGDESVATSVIDSSNLQKPKDINRFVKQNPQLARQVVYDVRTGKAMRFVKDQTGKFALIPADSADMDTTGEGMPDPNITPGLFGQKTKPEKELKEVLPDFVDPGFDEEFYQ
jgi:hypothetical protein